MIRVKKGNAYVEVETNENQKEIDDGVPHGIRDNEHCSDCRLYRYDCRCQQV